MHRRRILLGSLIVSGFLIAGCSGQPTTPSPRESTPDAPSITAQPQNQTIAPGASASLAVAANGPSTLAFQWFAGSAGDSGAPLTGATESVYVTPPISTAARYWVRVSSAGRSTDSETAVITISAEAPRITRQPKDETISAGATARLGVEAAGAALRYQWYRGASGSTNDPLAAEMGDKLTTPTLVETSRFWVRVSNHVGSIDSATSTVTIAAAPVPPPAPPPSGPTPPPPSGPGPGLLAYEEEVVTRINSVRATGTTCGSSVMPAVPAFPMNDALRSAARAHAQDMAARGYVAHTTPEGTTYVDRIQAAGYSGSPYGENIGVGYGTPAAAIAGWMSSPDHCAAIMSASFRAIGSGYTYRDGSPHGHYWTLNFGGR